MLTERVLLQQPRRSNCWKRRLREKVGKRSKADEKKLKSHPVFFPPQMQHTSYLRINKSTFIKKETAQGVCFVTSFLCNRWHHFDFMNNNTVSVGSILTPFLSFKSICGLKDMEMAWNKKTSLFFRVEAGDALMVKKVLGTIKIGKNFTTLFTIAGR